MLMRDTLTPWAFLTAIATCISGDEHAKVTEVDWQPIQAEQREVIYLAGGYWRLRAEWDRDGRLIGGHLVNPDYTGEQCDIAERGVAVLRRIPFRGGR